MKKRSNKFSLLTKLGGGNSAHSIIPFSGSKSKASVERLSNTYNRRACSRRLDNTCTRTHSDLRKRVFIHATREWNEKPWADVHGLPKCAYTDSLSFSLSLSSLSPFFSMNEFTPGTSLLSLRLFVSQPSSPLPSLSRSCSASIYRIFILLLILKLF